MSKPEVNLIEYRPWGSYEVVYSDRNFTTKILHVNPGARLSLQLHEYRDEIWSPVNDLIDVVVGGVESVLLPGENIKVPRGAVHRIINPHMEKSVQVVEVMTGKYSEEDIIRIDDDWNRE